MIKINRCRCPKLLTSPQKNKTLYNKQKVVNKLWEMQQKKCCYCESKIPSEGHLKAVEHFRPKSIFKNLTNNWTNLLLACSQCNGKKSDKFPFELGNDNSVARVVWIKKDIKKRALFAKGKCLLVNPADSRTNPEDNFDYIVDHTDSNVGLILHKTKIGKFTIEVVGLSDSFHTNNRKTLFYNLFRAYLNILEAVDKNDSNLLSTHCNTMLNYLHSNSQYAGFARAFAKKNKLDTRFNILIP